MRTFHVKSFPSAARTQKIVLAPAELMPQAGERVEVEAAGEVREASVTRIEFEGGSRRRSFTVAYADG